MSTIEFTLEADAHGFLMLTHPITEVSYQLKHDTEEEIFQAFPAIENEEGDFVWSDVPSHENNDLYWLIEDMGEF